MNDFNALCKEFESMDPLTFTEVFAVKSAKVIAALSAITKDGYTGLQIYQSFIVSAIMADGKLDVKEFNLISPALDKVVGREVTYEEAKRVFREMKKDAKDDRFIVDLMVDLLGLVSEELKGDIIILTMMVCAVDGKISMREKKWIKQLIE